MAMAHEPTCDGDPRPDASDPLHDGAPAEVPSGSHRARPGRRRWLLAGLGGLAIGGLVLGVRRLAHSDEDRRPTPRATTRDVPTLAEGRISFSAAYAARAGIATHAVASREVVPTVAASGTVTFDPKRVAAVGTRIGARLTEIEVVLGQRVEVGAVLGRLEAAELANAQATVEVLRVRSALATAEAARKRQLAAAGIAATRAAEMAESESRSLEVELRAASRRVRALGGREHRSRLGRFELRAPIAGEVIEVNAERGQPIEPNGTLFRVADLSVVWIELALFERDLGAVLPGDPVLLSPRSRPEIEVEGQVEHVARVLDRDSHTARVRVVVTNADHQLAIGESVVGRIRAQGEAVRAPAVPHSAIVLVDGTPTVFVVVEPGIVEARAIEIAAEGVEWVAVSAGLEPGDEVVDEGVFPLKSELFR